MAETTTMVFEEYLRSGEARNMGWLAGYPRSGAALVRTILAHCFGHRTGTIYKESHIGGGYGDALKTIPHMMTAFDLADMADAQTLLLFKTHSLPRPIEMLPTIIIVRDGRRTLESLLGFYRESWGIEQTMMPLIMGEHQWGSWSAWIRAWAAAAPAGALWLRYEDIMADVPGTVDRIAGWMGVKPLGHEIPPFESLHAGNPVIFRGCAVTGNGGMTDDEEAAFWQLHGSAMRMLGYYE